MSYVGLRRPLKSIALILAAVLAVMGLTSAVLRSSSTPAGAAVTGSPVDAQSAESAPIAEAIAQAYGHSVTVESLTTEMSQTVANPDGSLTLTDSTEPVRVRTASGAWTPIDTTLVAVGDVLSPRATTVPVQFSAGGSGPLARVQAPSGEWLGESWQAGTLPVPVVTDNQARYAEVLPGVDLVLTATATGMAQVLEVKNAAALNDPGLDSVTFGLSTPSLTVSGQPGGTAVAVTASGQVGLRAGSATWWDSASTDASAQGPGGAGEAQPIASTVSDTALTIDADAVASQPAPSYPVYIDPQWTGSTVHWTFTDNAYPSVSYWQSSGASDAYQHVGYIDAANSDDGKAHTTRSYWVMDVHSVAGASIRQAQFNVVPVYSSSCTPRAVQLWTVPAGVTPSTTWNNQPTLGTNLASQSFAKGYSSSCPADGAKVGFDAMAAVANAASQGTSQLTLALKADESDWLGWKKFDRSATIAITYVSYPTTPAGRYTVCNSPQYPGQCGANPFVRFPRPTFGAQSSQADGANLVYEFQVFPGTSPTPGGAREMDGTITTPPGSSHEWTPSAGGLPDGVHEWRVQACVYQYPDVCSDWSSFISFTVDTVGPQSPRIGFSGGLSTNDQAPAGTVGSTQETMTVIPRQADDNVWGYSWVVTIGRSTSTVQGNLRCDGNVDGFNTTCPGSLNPTATMTMAAVAPDTTFSVWAIDAAGNTINKTVSPSDTGASVASQTFFATPDSAGVAAGHRWPTNSTPAATCPTAVTVPDAPASASAADLSKGSPGNGLCQATDQVVGTNSQWALSGDGQSLDATTDHLVNTGNSFTVGAWLKATSVGPNVVQTAISQDGVNTSGFFLQNSTGYWRFCMPLQDSSTPQYDCAISSTAVTVNQWTFVAGEWDAVNQQLRIYVGGGSTPLIQSHAHSPNTTRSFIVGADKTSPSSRRFWTGRIYMPFVLPAIATPGQLGSFSQNQF